MAVSLGAGAWKVIGPIAGAAALVAGVVAFLASRPEVAGGTSEARVESVAKISARKAIGSTDALAKAAESDASPKVRQAALAELVPLMREKYRPVVEKCVRDADPHVRTVAAEAMGEFRDSPSVDVLINLVENDPAESVRLAALRSLADCDDPRATVVLLQTGETGSTHRLKLEAMKSLLRKFKGRLSESRNPSDEPRWRDLIQKFKWDARVRAAYAAAGVKIIDRPQDVLKPDAHPYRGGRGDSSP